MNKLVKIFVIGIMSCALALSAAAQTRKLTVALNFPTTDSVFAAITSIAADYMKQNPGVQIDVVTYPSYEDTMKIKMASNDLPDLWATHGWSVARYSEYLQPLNDQSWISKINPAIKPVITDKRGKVFVLPFDVSVAGIAFNRTVLDEAGVDPFKIKTWHDFEAACAKVKAIGKIPVDVGGSAADLWTVGNFYDWVAPSFLITNDKDNYREALKDGSFDWNKWAPVAKLLVDFRDSGFLNPDYTQGTWVDVGKRMAAGKLAFGFYGNYVIGEAKKYNPKGKYGFMPVPAASKDDTPSLITGEWVALGVWKDSKYKADALKFLAFCAKPANISKVATITGSPTGLVGPGYKSAQGDMTPYFKHCEGVRGFPYFDREYLPSGMWNTMCNTGIGLLANTMTIDQAVAKMKNDYDSLKGL